MNGLVLIYGGSIVYGVVAGYALPTAALFEFVPGLDEPGSAGRVLARALLIFAIAGAGLGWLAHFKLVDRRRLRRNEIKCVRLLRQWGLPLSLLLFVFVLSDGSWSGRSSPNFMSIDDLVPNSDAQTYWNATFEQLQGGTWNWVATHRSLAAMARQFVMTLAGLSYVGTLLVQTGLIASALFFAAGRLVRWRGLWVGLAFFALCLWLAGPFLTTMLTEPLALVWALISVVFLIDAFQLRSGRSALLSLSTFTMAMWMRMGAILAIPAFLVWFALNYASTLRNRIFLLAAGVAAVAAVLLIGQAGRSLYGDPMTGTGDNFASVVCGLAVGGDWTSCSKVFAQEMSKIDDRDMAEFLYAKARIIIFHDPSAAFRQMYENVTTLLDSIVFHMREGHQRVRYVMLAIIPGLLVFYRKAGTEEVTFWIMMLASTLVSAAIIFVNDGWRTMHVSWVVLSLLASFGFMSPLGGSLGRRVPVRPAISTRAGIIAIGGVTIAMFVLPWVSQQWWRVELSRHFSSANAMETSELTVLGSSVTGFLIVSDDQPRPRTVPSMHLSNFLDMVHTIRLEEEYRPFLARVSAKVPFAFVSAVPFGPDRSRNRLYLAPAEILADRKPFAWRLLINQDNARTCGICEVASAHPVP